MPDLVGEVAVAHDALGYEFHIVTRGAARGKRETQRVSAVLIHHVYGIDDIILRLAHLLALSIAHKAMQVDGMEWDDAQEVNTAHRHTRDPEEEDVVAVLHYRGWIEPHHSIANPLPPHPPQRPHPPPTPLSPHPPSP